MITVQVCVGSSCFIKGAPEIVEMLKTQLQESNLQDEVMLVGSFCSGVCNRYGVTVTVNDEVFTGITVEGFSEFWKQTILPCIEKNKS